VIVTCVAAATVKVETGKVTEIDPAGTVTVRGVVTMARFVLVIKTTAPPAGATALSVSVPVGEAPPTTLKGLIAKPVRIAGGGDTFSVAVNVTPPKAADIFGDAATEMGRAFTVKPAVVAPDGTVTVVGTVAAAVLSLDKLTTTPLAGAGPVSVTEPREGLPPVMAGGFNVSDKRPGERTESGVVCEMPP